MLTNRQCKLLKSLHTRHGRRKADEFLCEGLRCCREALDRRAEWLEFALCSSTFSKTEDFEAVLTLCQQTSAELDVVPDREFAELAATETPQGILCVMRKPPLTDPGEFGDGLLLVLDRIREPGNMGTILRTAWAVGLRTVWVTGGATDPFGPKTIRAGMGAQFALHLYRCSGLSEVRHCRDRGELAHVWCAVPRGGTSCFGDEFEPRGSALVIGNEATGIGDAHLGTPVSIPMPGAAESLNAAQAATVLLFEAVRRGVLPG